MRGDKGQALIMGALLVGLAAFAVVGIKTAGDALVGAVRDERAGEAAASAAAAAVADLLFARAGGTPDRATVAAFVEDDSVTLAAREAATGIARLHGRADPSAVTVEAFGLEIEVHLTLAGRQHIALIEPAP